jgi:hypothetical protein
MSDWTDKIVGDRLAVDNEFGPQIESSRFSRQQWGMIMTAATFEIEHPDDEDRAEIVANTDGLRGMMPEIETVGNVGPMGGRPPESSSGSGGVLESILGALGIGSGGKSDGVDEEKVQAAEALVDEYAAELQAHLEAEGRWTEIRQAAAES